MPRCPVTHRRPFPPPALSRFESFIGASEAALAKAEWSRTLVGKLKSAPVNYHKLQSDRSVRQAEVERMRRRGREGGERKGAGTERDRAGAEREGATSPGMFSAFSHLFRMTS